MYQIVGHTTRILRNRQLIRGILLGKEKKPRRRDRVQYEHELGKGMVGHQCGAPAQVLVVALSAVEDFYSHNPMWEFFNTTAGAATIVGLIVTLGAWWSGRGTNRWTSQVHADTQQLLNAIDAHAHERHQEDMREINTDQPAYPNDYMQEAT